MDLLILRWKKIELSGHMNYDFLQKKNYLKFFANFAKRNTKLVINSYGMDSVHLNFRAIYETLKLQKITVG